jgi:hypothetical protein
VSTQLNFFFSPEVAGFDSAAAGAAAGASVFVSSAIFSPRVVEIRLIFRFYYHIINHISCDLIIS